MTDTKNTVSDERLAEMLSGKIGARDQYHVGTFAYRRLDDDVIALTELQSLRASIPGGVGVKDADLRSFAETVDLIAEGDFYKDYDRAIAAIEPMRRTLSALDLSPAEGEPVAWVSHGQIITNVDEALYLRAIPLYAAPSNPVISDKMVERAVNLEYLATVLSPDPYDDRSGPYYATAELRAIEALRPGDRLYVSRSGGSASEIITDGMVDRAIARWFLKEDISDCADEMKAEWRDDMRAALTAALSVKPQSDGGKP